MTKASVDFHNPFPKEGQDSEPGPHVISFERTKTCGTAAPEKMGISCAKIHIK